ncbi:MAG TPA: hypothetical protein VGK53_20620, partial [Propionicimonas sp.]
MTTPDAEFGHPTRHPDASQTPIRLTDSDPSAFRVVPSAISQYRLPERRNNPARPPSWTRRYARRLMFSDAAIVFATLGVSVAALKDRGTDSVTIEGFGQTSYGWAMAGLGLIWLAALNIIDTRSDHIVRHGNIEAGRIVNATIAGFLTTLAIAFFLRVDLARSIFVISAPFGLMLLLLS